MEAIFFFAIAIIIAISLIVSFFVNWPITFPIAVPVAIGYYFYRRRAKRLEAEKNERERLAALAERERKAEEKRKADAESLQRAELFLARLTRLILTHSIIDANVWMNQSYDPFFKTLSEVLRLSKRTLVIYGEQFDELSNLKRKTTFNDTTNHFARMAISRIEKMQIAGCVRIQAENIVSRKGAYADPFIIRLLASSSKRGESCSLFSDDRELRIRVRQVLTDSDLKEWEVVDVAELLDDCKNYCYAMTLEAYFGKGR